MAEGINLSGGITLNTSSSPLDEAVKRNKEKVWKTSRVFSNSVIDGDSVYLEGFDKQARVSGSFGSLDTFETSHGSVIDNKNSDRLQGQFGAASKALNKPLESVTVSDVTLLGEQAKDALRKGIRTGFVNTQEGFVGPKAPTVEYLDSGEVDTYGRPVLQIRNPVTKENLGDKLNTSKFNADFDSRYNKDFVNAEGVSPEQRLKKAVADRPRTSSEILSDTGKQINAGMQIFPKISYGITDFLTRPKDYDKLVTNSDGSISVTKIPGGREIDGGLDNFLKGYIHQVNNTLKENHEGKSEQLRTSVELTQEANVRDASIAKGEELSSTLDPKVAKLITFGTGIKDSISNLIDQPLALQDAVVSSVPSLVAGGVAGKAVSTAVFKNASKEFLASKAGQKAVGKVAERVGMANVVAQEAVTGAVDAKQEVLGKSVEELLQTSTPFKELMDSNPDKDPELLKRQLANKVFDSTFALSALTATFAARVTGAGKQNARLLDNVPTPDGIIKATTKAGLKEGSEEALQGAGNTVSTSISNRLYVDDKTDVLEGAGQAAGAGLLVGSIAGAGTFAGVGLLKGNGETVQNIKDTAKKASTNYSYAKQEKQDIKENFKDVVTDPESPSYDPIRAINKTTTQITSKDIETSKEENTKLYEETVKHKQNLIRELDTLDRKETLTPEETKRLQEINTVIPDVLSKVNNAKTIAIDAKQEAAKNKRDIKEASTSKTPTEAASRVLESINEGSSTITVEELQAVSNNDSLDEYTKKAVNNTLATNKALSKVVQLGNTSPNVLGDVNNKQYGAVQYANSIKASLGLGNKTQAKDTLKALKSVRDKSISIATTLQTANNTENVKEAIKVAKSLGIKVKSKQEIQQLEEQYTLEAKAVNAIYKEQEHLVLRKPSVSPSKTSNESSDKNVQDTQEVAVTSSSEVAGAGSRTVGELNLSGYKGTDLDQVAKKIFKGIVAPKKLDKAVNELLDSLPEQTSDISDKQHKASIKAFIKGVVDRSTSEADYGIRSDSYQAGQRLTESLGKAFTYSISPEVGSLSSRSIKGKSLHVTEIVKVSENKNNILHISKDVPSAIKEKATEAQKNSAEHLTNYIKVFKENLNKIKRDASKIKFGEDLSWLLTDKDGNLLEYVQDSLAVASYNWIGDNSEGSLLNTPSDVTRMFGLPEDTYLPTELVSMVAEVGYTRNNVLDSLVSSISKLSGLTQLPDSSINKENIDRALAMLTLQTMLDMKAVNQTKIPTKNISSLLAEPIDSEGAISNFIRAASIQKGDIVQLNPKLGVIKEHTQSGIIKTLFGLEKRFVEPKTTKPSEKDISDTVKRSTQEITKEQQKTLLVHAQRENEFDTSAINLAYKLGKENLLLAFGFNNDIENTIHKRSRIATKSENLRLVNSFKNLEAFAGKVGLDSPIYFLHEIVGNGRVQMLGNINTQSDKWHRVAINSKGWKTPVNTPERLLGFKKAIAFAFDVPVKDSEKFFDGVQQEDSEVFQILDILENTVLTEEQKVTVSNFIAKQDEPEFAFKALSELLKYRKDPNFETSIIREVDGTNNGVIISLFLYSSGLEDVPALNRGGVFTSTTDYSSTEEFKGTGALDTYEVLTKDWESRNLQSLDNEDGRALRYLIGNYVLEDGSVTTEGRKAAKGHVVKITYAASPQSLRKELGESTIDTIEALIVKNKDNTEELQQISKMFTILTGIRTEITKENALEDFLSPQQQIRIKDYVDNSMGENLEDALNNQMGGLTGNAKKLISMTSLAFEAFNLVYQRELQQLKDSLPEGQVPSKEQIAELLERTKEFQPIIRHPQSGDRVKTGLQLLKTSLVRSKEEANKVKVSFKGRQTGSNSMTSYNTDRVVESPGVSPVAKLTHTLDSSTMQEVLKSHDVLNVHDAIGVSIDSDLAAALTLNESFYNNIKNYSVVTEGFVMLTDVLKNVRKYDQENGVSTLGELNKAIRGEKETSLKGYFKESKNFIFPSVEAYYGHIKNEVIEINKNKKEVLETVTKIDQYSEGTTKAVYSTDLSAESVLKDLGITATSEEDVVAELSEKYVKELSSSVEDLDLNNFQADVTVEYSKEDPNNLFETLASLDPNNTDSLEHNARLKEVMNSIVNKVIKPLDVFIKTTGNENTGKTDSKNVYVNLASNPSIVATPMSAQEVLTHEFVHIVTAYGIDNNKVLRSELSRLSGLVKKNLKPIDLLDTSKLLKDEEGNYIKDDLYYAEVQKAKDLYNHMFANKNVKTYKERVNGGVEVTRVVTNGLHEFLTLGITNKLVVDAINKIDPNKNGFSKGFVGRLEKLFNKIQMFVNTLLGKSNKNKKVESQLIDLAKDFAGVNYKKRSTLASKARELNDLLDPKGNQLLKTIASPIVKYVGSKRFRESKILPVRVVANFSFGAAYGKFKDYTEVLNRTGRLMRISESSLIATTAREVQGLEGDVKKYERMLQRTNVLVDSARKDAATNVTSVLKETFNGKLSKDEDIAMTKVMGMSDLSSLFSTYNLKEVKKLLSSDTYRLQEIDNKINELRKYGSNGNFYVNQAMGLGKYMLTGYGQYGQLKNAYAIANINNKTLLGDKELQGDITHAEAVIDTLASLEALNHVSETSRNTTLKMFNLKEEAMLFTVQLMLKNKKGVLDKQFDGQKSLIRKGYVKDTLDNNISFVIADLRSQPELLKQGFVLANNTPIESDKLANTENQYMYINKDIHLARWEGKILSLTSERAKGSRPVLDNKGLQTYKTKLRKELLKQFEGIVPVNTDNKLVPVISNDGIITSFNYELKEHVKESLLDKSMDFFNTVGAVEAQVIDKVNSKKNNRLVLEELQEDYRTTTDKSLFVKISERSLNSKYAELWKQLPEDTKEYALEVFGKDFNEGRFIRVRKALIPLVIGQRKLSVTHLEYTDDAVIKANFTMSERIMNALAKGLHKPALKTTEAVWQEIAKGIKDIVVVKSGIVSAANIASNNWQLWVEGVGLEEIVADQTEGITLASKFFSDKTALLKAELLLSVDYKLTPNEKTRLVRDVINLKEALQNNNITPLMENGIFQAIIEDMDFTEDNYTYKSKLDKRLEPLMNKLPKSAITAGKVLTISHETKLYRLLNKTVQFSDLVARYTLHKHNLKKGMTEEDSFKHITDVFINYDLPSHPILQYTNDMMLTPFTKFKLRIQKVILRNVVKSPVRLLGLLGVEGLIGEQDNTLDVFLDTPYLSTPLDTLKGIEILPTINIPKSLL